MVVLLVRVLLVRVGVSLPVKVVFEGGEEKEKEGEGGGVGEGEGEGEKEEKEEERKIGFFKFLYFSPKYMSLKPKNPRWGIFGSGSWRK